MVGEDHTQPLLPAERIRGGRRPPFRRVSVSASKKQLIKDIARKHPKWRAGQYIQYAKTKGVTLTSDEVWSALNP